MLPGPRGMNPRRMQFPDNRGLRRGEVQPGRAAWMQGASWARAAVGGVVWTQAEIVERERGADRRVDRLDDGERLGAAGDVRLIGDADEEKAGVVQRAERRRRAGGNRDAGQVRRRQRTPVAQHRFVQHAITIEKYGSAHETRCSAFYMRVEF